jgi:DNA polymerase-3 subunit epsilon
MTKPFVRLCLARPLIVLDLETPGTSPRTDRVVEIAAVKYAPLGSRERFHRLVNPGIPIPGAATAVHGLTDGDVADCPPFEAVAAPLARFLRDSDLAGFNLCRFDLPFLLAEFARAGIDFSLGRRAVIDVMRLYHLNEPRDLAAAVRHYLEREHGPRHNALADAYATAAVLDEQLLHYPDLPRNVTGLHGYLTDVDLGGRLRRDGDRLVLNFGKYAGVCLRQVAAIDPDYLRWLLAQDFLPDFLTIVRQALDQAGSPG